MPGDCVALADAWGRSLRKLNATREVTRTFNRQSKNPSPPDALAFDGLNYAEFDVVARSLHEAILLDVYRLQLGQLNLSRCNMDDKKVGMLCAGLRLNCSLRKLVLNRNPLGPDNVARVCDALLAGMLERMSLRSAAELRLAEMEAAARITVGGAASPTGGAGAGAGAAGAGSGARASSPSRAGLATPDGGVARGRVRLDRIMGWRGLQSLSLADCQVRCRALCRVCVCVCVGGVGCVRGGVGCVCAWACLGAAHAAVGVAQCWACVVVGRIGANWLLGWWAAVGTPVAPPVEPSAFIPCLRSPKRRSMGPSPA
jgi:hypothetical protein